MHTVVRNFHLHVVSIEKTIFSKAVSFLQVTSSYGELSILPGHAPFLGAIKPGILRILHQTGEDLLYISGGFLEVQGDNVVILADTVMRADELDAYAAERAKNMHASSMQYSFLTGVEESQDLSKALAKLRALRLTRQKNNEVG